MGHKEQASFPHPEEFAKATPEYEELRDGYFQASLRVAGFEIVGQSATRPGARRAALHEAARSYHSYSPAYEIPNPFPDNFVDQENVRWARVPQDQRAALGDYSFCVEEDEIDYADIPTMLIWDVRPASTLPSDKA